MHEYGVSCDAVPEDHLAFSLLESSTSFPEGHQLTYDEVSYNSVLGSMASNVSVPEILVRHSCVGQVPVLMDSFTLTRDVRLKLKGLC